MTPLSYRKWQKCDPHRIKIPDPTGIGIRFGTVDYVRKMTPGAKFHADPCKGDFLANG